MIRGTAVRGLFTGLALTIGVTSASAQVFGTFTWQMQPYCNKVTLTLTSVTGNFTLDGSDDLCGAAKKASAVGIGIFNPDGTVGLSVTIVLPGGTPVHVSAAVSPANGQGTWTDDLGLGGTFAFFGATPGLPLRSDGPVYFRAQSHLAAVSGDSNVVFTNVTHNTGGGSYDATTGTYTVPVSGMYSINYSVGWNPGTTTSGRACAFIVTPTTIDMSSCAPLVGNSSFVALSGATVIPLSAGNTINIGTNESSTGTGVALLSSVTNGLTIIRLR